MLVHDEEKIESGPFCAVQFTTIVVIVIRGFLLLLFPFFTTFNKEILYLQYGNLTKMLSLVFLSGVYLRSNCAVAIDALENSKAKMRKHERHGESRIT